MRSARGWGREEKEEKEKEAPRDGAAGVGGETDLPVPDVHRLGWVVRREVGPLGTGLAGQPRGEDNMMNIALEARGGAQLSGGSDQDGRPGRAEIPSNATVPRRARRQSA